MSLKSFILATMFSIVSFAQAAPVQVGQAQTWVELPDFQALAATASMDAYVDAFDDSLHSVNVLAQNSNGLTLAGAMDVLSEFNANANTDIGSALPCDEIVIAIRSNMPDSDLPDVVILNTVISEEDCEKIRQFIEGNIDEIKDPSFFQDCIGYDEYGNCNRWIRNKPCESWQDDCECVAYDDQGNCIAWTHTGPEFDPGGSGGDGYDLDNDDDYPDDTPPTTGGGSGEGGGGEGGGEGGGGGGGGGGGNPSAAGVSSTDGKCANQNDSDQTAPNGPNQTTANPVLRAPGYKYEDDTDLTVELPGRDFVLRRTYNAAPASASSRTPWMIGGGWGTTIDGWIKFTPHGAAINDAGNFELNSLPEHLSVTLMPIQNGKKYYRLNGVGEFKPGVALSGGPTDSVITASTGSYAGQTISNYILQGEGAGATYFINEGPADGSLDYVEGRIYRQIDAEGGVWNFQYLDVLGDDGESTWARLSKIYLNGSTSANSDAVVSFEWDLGTETEPGTGLLRSISVTRPHIQPTGGLRHVVTQYVRYTYDSDDFFYGHLNDGSLRPRLVLVERGSLLNAPMPGDEVDASLVNSFEYHRQYTHFRYKQAILVKETTFFGLLNTHLAGLMTHRFEPHQIEYYMEQYLQQNPSASRDDAVQALLEAELDDDVPGAAMGTHPVSGLASKVISYYGLDDIGDPGSGYAKGQLAFRVKSQYIQSACGCSGSASYKYESFKYSRNYHVDREGWFSITIGNATAYVAFQAARESSVTILTEGVPSTDPENPFDSISRKTYTWGEEQLVYAADAVGGYNGGQLHVSYENVRSPFTIGNHVVDSYTDGTSRQWTSFHEFDVDDLTRTSRYHPSAVSDVSFEDGTNGTYHTGLLLYTESPTVDNRSALDAKGAFTLRSNAGFVEHWTYNDLGRETSYTVQQGTSGPAYLKYTKAYSTEGGRGDLLRKQTHFATDGTTELLETNYSYLFHALTGVPTTAKIVTQKTTSILLEDTDENGPGGPAKQTTIEHFSSSNGLLTRIEHPDGTETSFDYTRGTNAVSRTGRWLTMTREAKAIGGVTTPPNLVTEQYFDAAGRMRSMTSPEGVTTYTEFGLEPLYSYTGDPGSAVMDDDTNPSSLEYLTVTTYPHDMGSGKSPRFAGPATKSWASAGLNLLREDQYEVNDFDVLYHSVVDPDLSADPTSMTIHRYSPTGSHYETRVWHDIAATVANPNDVDESSYLTQFSYDALGRLNMMIDHAGTVTETQYDADNRTIRLWVYPENGTRTLRSEFFYDYPYDDVANPEAGLGDGNLTLERQYVSGTTGDYRDTVHIYDWQNRKRMSFVADSDAVSPHATSLAGSASVSVLDNMDRPVAAASLEGGVHTAVIQDIQADGLTVSELFASNSGAITRTHYGRRGLPFATESAIDPTDEDDGYLRVNTWYDDAGRVVTSVGPNGSVTKTQYDGFSRPYRVIVVDGDSVRNASTYAEAVSLLDADNIILEESETIFDDIGRVKMSISRTRDHLSQDPGVAPSTGLGSNPITTYAMPMYDDVSRPIATVSFGTRSDDDVFESGGAPPSFASNVTIQDLRNDSKLIVTETQYDEIGRPHLTIDPLGRSHKVLFDDLGRSYATIENYVDNGQDIEIGWYNDGGHYEVKARDPSDAVDENRVTSSVFDFAGNITKRVAHLRDGNGDEVVQITEYEYDPTNATTLTSYNQSDLYGRLYRIRYPQPGDGHYTGSDGQPGTAVADTVEFAYNYLGEQVASRDQNGTIRTFERDGLGRLTIESVNTFGSDVDTSVDTLTTDYDEQGRVERNRSFNIVNDPSLSTPLNEVLYHYNPRGDLIKLDQLALGGTTTRSLEWSYITNAFDAATNPNEHRLEWMEYPDGARFVPQYGDSDATNPLDSRIDRVRGFELRESDYTGAGDEIQLVSYEHLGLGTVARTDFGGYQTDRSVDDQAGTREQAGSYPGWDRFGRLKSHTTVHSNYGGNSSGQGQFYSESFTYDQLSNRLSKLDNRLSAIDADNSRDFAYSYDALNRLIEADRGIHTDGLSNNDDSAESRRWELDELGNWGKVHTGTSGAESTDEREHNGTNELTEMNSATVSYDDNGNMTGMGGRDFIYDAWNRLVRVEQGSTTIAEYEYNSLHWRVAKRAKDSTGTDTQRLMYYSPSWQLVYEDLDVSFVPASGHESTRLASTFWGKRHIDDALYRAIDENDDNIDGIADGDGIYERGFSYLTDNQFSVVGVVDADGNTVYERLRYDSYGAPSHSYPEDVDGDGDIDYFDVNAAVNGSSSYYSQQNPIVDFNFDGSYSYFDVSTMTAAYQEKSAVGAGWLSDDGAYGPGNRIGFMGYHWEPEIGMWLGRNRMYSPEAGRWLQRDPAGYVDGLSLYLFVRGNPLSYIDPMGLCSDQKSLENELGITRGVGNGGNEGGVLTEEETKKLREAYAEFEEEMVEAGKEMAKAAVFVATIVTPGPEELILGAIMAKYGWVAKGGKLVDKAGNVIDANKAKKMVAAEKANVGSVVRRADNADDVPQVTRNRTNGLRAEAAVRAKHDIGPEGRIKIGDQVRKPDGLTNTTLSEVKNVEKLSNSAQLRDMLFYAQQNGLDFDLYVRADTKLSRPLQALIDNGYITKKLIPTD